MIKNLFNRENLRKTILGLIGLGILGYILLEVAVFVVIGFPDNPPVETTVQWDTPRTQELWNRACNDCHSNETIWPWYSYVAPVSALVIHDVQEGREKFNISTGNTREAHEASELIHEGEMPPPVYLPMHPTAKLTTEEQQELINGLQATFPRGGR